MRFLQPVMIASLAAMTTAGIAPNSVLDDELLPIDKRQEPGTPAYSCHESCGNAITDSKTEGYCTSQAWLKLLDDCLACANKFDIWKYYGTKVGAAAKTCGLDAAPKPADDEVSSSSQNTEPATESRAPVSTAANVPIITSASTHKSFAPDSTSTVTNPPTAVPSPKNNGTTTNIPTVTAGGSRNLLSGGLVIGAATLVVAALC